MRVLVTGVTGQVGRAIATCLADKGCHVTGVSRHFRPVSGLSEHIEASLGSDSALDVICNALQPCEAIVHAAACVTHDEHDPSISLTNCLGAQQVVELAQIWKSVQLVYTSSVPVIGRPVQHPITEDHPLQPATVYHASKLYGEHVMHLAEDDGCHAVSLRLTSPCGPGTPENRIMGVFARRAAVGETIRLLGRGTRKQNYVDVRDVALAVELCLTKNASGVYNIAGADSISNWELAKTCIDELRSSSGIEFAGKPDPEEGTEWDVSVDKASRDLGYRPRFTPRDSIQAIAQESRRNSQPNLRP